MRLAYLAGDLPPIDGTTRLKEQFAKGLDRKIVVAAAELGSIQLSATALADAGVTGVTPFWDMSEAYVSVARKCGAVLVDLRDLGNSRQIFRELAEHQRRGAVPFFTLEAPSASFRTYDFLGYRVRLSRLVTSYAEATGSSILLVWNVLVGDSSPQIRFLRVEAGAGRSLQKMLDHVGREVRDDPLQYAWDNAAFIFSDDLARKRALARLDAVVDWRDTIVFD